MELVALVTLLIGMQCMFFMAQTGKARIKYEVAAPAVTGNDIFERTYRVHQNTIEQLLIQLPAMWVCGMYLNGTFAAAMGVAFIIGRFLYGAAYVKDPASRGPGMMIGFISTSALLLGGLWGVISSML